ncbi:MAG: hypothetical protein L0154_15920, partial [Chloroflexi bacterium]|nr:hypothetical protein [Chloroflexota bacterium]
MVDEIIIGYDIRDLEYDFSWASERIDKYLLRKRQVRPLSTDVSVWASCFDVELPLDMRTRNNVDLWRNLQIMIDMGSNKSTANEVAKPVAIAVTVFGEPELSLDHLDLSDIHPPQIESDWEFLGYDVSDKFLLSVLTNCGYSEEESGSFGQMYADHLNEYHLFTDLNMAINFRSRSDERVKEHSPFCIYGIYALCEIGLTKKNCLPRWEVSKPTNLGGQFNDKY